MQISYTYLIVDKNPHLEEHAAQELKKIARFIHDENYPSTIDIIFNQEGHGTHFYSVELKARLPLTHIVVTHKDNDIYRATTKAVDLLIDEMHKQKDRIISKRKEGVGETEDRSNKKKFQQ